MQSARSKILSGGPSKASRLKIHKPEGDDGAFKESHYRSVYFHKSGPEVDRAHDHYLNSISKAVDRFRKENNVFVVLVAMEKLDTEACHVVSEASSAALR
ncbi:MAG: hypothetical protein IPG76_23750 [Acidobacteria bacterium]|nr:hypothetical protein [Acidobacteriota bacterium]